MKSVNTNLLLKYFLVFSFLILRGYAIGGNEPKKSNADILLELKGKSVIEILGVANSYSYKDLNLSLACAKVALEKAQLESDKRNLFDVQRDIGFIYEDNSLGQKAAEAYQNAIPTAQLLGDSALSTLYNDLAIVNRKLGNFRKAYDYYEQTIFHANRIQDIQMLESSFHGQGQLHKEVGIYDKAIDFYLKSLALSEKSENILNIIVSHNDISDAYLKAKETEKALQHVEKAYRLASEYYKNRPKDEDALMELASVINRYGNILTERKEYDQALSKFQESFTIYNGKSYKVYIAKITMSMANIYMLKGDYVRADKEFKECLKYESLFLVADLIELHHKIGVFYKKIKKTEEAEKAFTQCLALSTKYENKSYAQKANYEMFLICLDKHENNKALKFLDNSNALNDSLFNAEKLHSTAQIEFKFDMEKKENEIHAFKLREKDLNLKQNRIMLMSSIIFFAMVILFLVYTIQLRGKNFRTLEQKNAEVELQYRKLEESNEILSQFAYVAAHDLKEPLRSIGSYIGLIQMKHGKILPEDAKEYMVFVNKGVKRMYSLLTDLLDFSQVISQQPGSEEVLPNDILSDVKDNLRSAIDARDAQITYPANLPMVKMNRLHMTQLFQNLIGNALKFTDKPPVVNVDAKEENGNILITIEDNGIGIKKEYANKVFVLFQQLNKKEQFDGTGIGLTICKNIVEKYNGKIWFESQENVGTKFYISIPVAA